MMQNVTLNILLSFKAFKALRLVFIYRNFYGAAKNVHSYNGTMLSLSALVFVDHLYGFLKRTINKHFHDVNIEIDYK